MIRADPLPSAPGIELIGVLRGLVAEEEPLARALAALRPSAIGLGLSPEEAASLAEHFLGTPTEPLVPLLPSESVELRQLARYGEARVPHPAYLVSMREARRRGIPCEGIDPGEDRYAELFSGSIGYLELVRRTLRERRLLRSPPRPPDPESFVLAWDRRLNRGRGSRRLQAAREAHAARELERLRAAFGPTVVGVVDRERWEGVRAALAATGAPARGRA